MMESKIKPDNATLACDCTAEDIVLLPCAGGSNCGQITNHVAVSLSTMGIGHIYCLAGIGAHIDGMIESVKGAKRVVVLDGCSIACAKKIIEHAGLKVTDWLCVTDEGISKSHSLTLEEEDIEIMIERTRKLLARPV